MWVSSKQIFRQMNKWYWNYMQMLSNGVTWIGIALNWSSLTWSCETSLSVLRQWTEMFLCEKQVFLCSE